jgi:hypothetical protein
MPRGGFEPSAPVFEQAKTVQALYIYKYLLIYILRLNAFSYLYNSFKYLYTNCRRTGPVTDFNIKILRSIQLFNLCKNNNNLDCNNFPLQETIKSTIIIQK